MKYKINHLIVLSRISVAASVVCAFLEVWAKNFLQPPQIIENMYQPPADIKAITLILSSKIATTDLTVTLHNAFIYFMIIAALIKLYSRVKILEEKLNIADNLKQ